MNYGLNNVYQGHLMSELNNIKKQIPNRIRRETAIKMRDYKEVARVSKQALYEDFGYIVDIYNDKDIMRDPDKIAITVFYPKTNSTHMLTGTFDISLKENQFAVQVKRLYKKLKKKAKL